MGELHANEYGSWRVVALANICFVSGLLMETGVSYNKQRLHKVRYFGQLMTTNKEVQQSIRPLLKLSRDMISRSQSWSTRWSVLWSEIHFCRSGCAD